MKALLVVLLLPPALAFGLGAPVEGLVAALRLSVLATVALGGSHEIGLRLPGLRPHFTVRSFWTVYGPAGVELTLFCLGVGLEIGAILKALGSWTGAAQ